MSAWLLGSSSLLNVLDRNLNKAAIQRSNNGTLRYNISCLGASNTVDCGYPSVDGELVHSFALKPRSSISIDAMYIDKAALHTRSLAFNNWSNQNITDLGESMRLVVCSEIRLKMTGDVSLHKLALK